MTKIQVKRGTRAQITSAKSGGTINIGEPYLVTDESRLEIGLSTTTTQAMAKLSEAVPTGGTTNQLLAKNSNTNYDLTWVTPSSSGSITNTSSALTGDVQMPSSNTWYDGPSVSLAAGTWLVMAHLTQIRSATTAESVYARISDGTNHYASQQAYHPSASGSGCNFALNAIITLGSTTTIKAQCATSAGATTSVIKAAMAANGAGNNASRIIAIKLS